MSEQPQIGPDDGTQPYDWQQAAAEYRNWDPALHGFVEQHLAEQGIEPPQTAEWLDTNPELYEAPSELSRLLDEAANDEDAPEPNNFDVYGEVIRSGEYTDSQLGRYMSHLKQNADARNEADNKLHGSYGQPSYYAEMSILKQVPTERLSSLYANPHTEGGDQMRKMIHSNIISGDAEAGAHVLAKAYGYRRLLTLKAEKGEQHDDEIVQHLFSNEEFDEIVMDEVKDIQSELAKLDPATATREMRELSHRILNDVFDVPPKLSRALELASLGRTSRPDAVGQYSATRLNRLLSSVAFAVRKIGPKNLEMLHDKAGIVNFDTYSEDHLKLMVRVCNGDPEAVAHLQNGDTTAVFRDAMGDFTGVFVEGSNLYRTSSKRTLFFEMSQPGDFYRQMLLLRNAGVKPSTIIMDAHGVAGSMAFATGSKAPRLDAERTRPDSQLVVEESRGLQKIVRKFMQNSRGINDDPSDRGSRRIILAACETDLAPEGSNQKTMIEAVAAKANHPAVRVYGSESVIDIDRQDGYLNFYQSNKHNKDTQAATISRTHRDFRGHLVKTQHSYIMIEKEPPKDE